MQLTILFTATFSSMSSACPICEIPYDRNNCKPLILPCGHIMCHECLLKFEGKSKICTICNISWADSSVESLSICPQLISGEILKPVYTLWCNSCRSTTCEKNVEMENNKCDLIHVDEKCLKSAIEYTDLCKKISIKKLNYEKFLEETMAFCKILREEIHSLSHVEKQNNEQFIEKQNSDQKKLAILDDHIKHSKEFLTTKLPVTTLQLLSHKLSALQVNCYLFTFNFTISASPIMNYHIF